MFCGVTFYDTVYSLWMNGPMTGVDPDKVESDTGIYWRTLYKLEKHFNESPEPLKMAQKVTQSLSIF